MGDTGSTLPSDLRALRTLSDLVELVGKLTPEEEELLRKAREAGDPTEEELAALGPNFGERVMERVRHQLDQQ